MQKENAASTLAGDNVGECVGRILHKTLDDGLALAVHHKLRESLRVKLDRGDVVEVDLIVAACLKKKIDKNENITSPQRLTVKEKPVMVGRVQNILSSGISGAVSASSSL